MNDLRTAVQQVLEACEQRLPLKGQAAIIDELNNLRAALTQQTEPDHETRAELAEQQVVQLAEERDHYRNLWQKAQQAEPVQQTRKDGHYSVAYRCKCGHEQNVTEIVQDDCTYVGSGANWCDGCGDGPPVRVDAMQQQAEPMEPVAWDVTKNGRLIYDYDFTHDAVLRVMGDFEDDEQRVRYAKQIVDKLNAAPAQQAEPVAWRSENANPPGGYVIFQQYPQALADLGKPIQPLYTAPPQRTMVPLTAQELDGVIERHVGGSEITDDMYTSMEQFARAVEKASWEKNNG